MKNIWNNMVKPLSGLERYVAFIAPCFTRGYLYLSPLGFSPFFSRADSFFGSLGFLQYIKIN